METCVQAKYKCIITTVIVVNVVTKVTVVTVGKLKMKGTAVTVKNFCKNTNSYFAISWYFMVPFWSSFYTF